MNRAALAAHVASAEDRFRARIAQVKWFYRDEIAAAAAALARELEAVDFTTSEAVKRLAMLIKAPVELRDAPPAPSSRRPTVDPYSMPPDQEGDEPLLDRMKKLRGT